MSLGITWGAVAPRCGSTLRKTNGRAAAPSGAQDSGANVPFLYRGGFAAQVGRRRPPARSLRLGERAIPWGHEGRCRAAISKPLRSNPVKSC